MGTGSLIAIVIGCLMVVLVAIYAATRDSDQNDDETPDAS